MNNNLNKFDFDFNLGSNFSSNQSKPLKDQTKQQPHQQSSSFSTTYSSKPSWTHQPLPSQPTRPGLSNPTSMVGDISGKSWNSTPPTNSNMGSGLGIGVVEKNPNLFGDLVGSVLGGKTSNNTNVPLKNAPLKSTTPPVSAQTGLRNAYSMGNLGPKTGSGESLGSYNSSKIGGNLGGPSMKSGGGGGGLGTGVGATTKKDPFGSLLDFGMKKDANLKGSNNRGGGSGGDYSFGEFQNAGKSKPTTTTPLFSSSKTSATNTNSMGSNTKIDDFGDFGSIPSSTVPNTSSNFDSFGDFEIPIQKTSSEKPAQSESVDPLEMFFPSSSAAPTAGGQPFSEMDDWNLDAEYGGEEAGGTTELDGLPPPPAGVSVSVAKNKGMDNYKQGQHPDAIKWLTWAVVLLEKAGDDANVVEVLSCRASCYKEVGEYKKAIADCTKVLEQDADNVSVLVQRALLYESTEKYKLGAEDLRTVLKIDPANRLARSTIHRLNKLAE